MSAEEFNEKYKAYLEEGHYGLALSKPEAIEYLDKEFEEFIKLPDFSYSQIKSKFNEFRFYNIGVSHEKTREVENKLKEIHEAKPSDVCTFNQSKWLKEKGYKQTRSIRDRDYYTHKGILKGDVTDYIKALVDKNEEDINKFSTIKAPKHHEVIEWLRTNYGIWVWVEQGKYDEIIEYYPQATNGINYKLLSKMFPFAFNTPQEAYSSAFDYIKENNLI